VQQASPLFLAVFALLALVGGVSVGLALDRHRRVAAALSQRARPAVLGGHEVALVDGLPTVVVAGLRRPRTYCPSDLSATLDASELRAVLLHEHHHQLTYAPFRLALLDAVRPLVAWFDAGRGWCARRRASIEIDADAYAIARGSSRSAVASALLNLAGGSPAALAGFAISSELRLRALLDGREPARGPRLLPLLAAFFVAALTCSFVVLG
jgi:beta-lactamase regulating signal transducer with metallopeptidase domain